MEEHEPPGPENGREMRTPSLWEMERLIQGEITGEEAEVLRERIGASPEHSAYLARIEEQAHGRSFASLQRLLDAQAGYRNSDPSQTVDLTGTRTGNRNPRLSASHAVSRLRGFPPRLAFAVLLVSVACLWVLLPDLERWKAKSASTYTMKGKDRLEARLHLGAQRAEAGQALVARAGDTLGFSYRCPSDRHVQVWYREERKEPVRFPGTVNAGPWPASIRWVPAQFGIVLNGDWAHQEIWVVSSDRILSEEEARSLILGRSPSKAGVEAISFQLQREERDALP